MTRVLVVGTSVKDISGSRRRLDFVDVDLETKKVKCH
jgi:hypothetical protein